jgi:hypothetical protein
MNLILSDVEETIMIVEVTEGAPEGHGTVNVSSVPFAVVSCLMVLIGRKTKDGYVVRERRWCHSGNTPGPASLSELIMSI